jgi:hypothetical protein
VAAAKQEGWEREASTYTWDVIVNGHNPEVYKDAG